MPPKNKRNQKQRKSKALSESISETYLTTQESEINISETSAKNSLIDELRILNLNDQKDVVKAQLARVQKENEELRAQLGKAFVGEMFSLEELRSKAERSQEYAQAILMEGVAKEKEYKKIIGEKDALLAEKDRKLQDALKEVEWLEVQVRERDQQLEEKKDATERALQLSEELVSVGFRVNRLKQELSIRNRQLAVLSQLDNHRPMDNSDTPFSPDPFGSPDGKSSSLGNNWSEEAAVDGRSGMAPMVLEAMRLFHGNAKLQRECCLLLAHLSSDSDLIKGLAQPEINGAGVVLAAMHKHRMELGVQSSGCRMITKFANVGFDQRQRIHAAGTVAMILDTLTNFSHSEHRGLQYNSVLALKTLLPPGQWIVTDIREEVSSDEEEASPQDENIRSPGQKVTGSLSERVRSLKRQTSKPTRSPAKVPVLNKKNSSFSLPAISPGKSDNSKGSVNDKKESKRAGVDIFETLNILISCLCWCREDCPQEQSADANNDSIDANSEDILVQALRLLEARKEEVGSVGLRSESPGSRGSSRSPGKIPGRKLSVLRKQTPSAHYHLDELISSPSLRNKKTLSITSIPAEKRIQSRGASREVSSRQSSGRSAFKQQSKIENPWTKVSTSKLVQCCCISLVLAVESDNTVKSRRFLRHERTVSILVETMRRFRHDSDIVAASCICLRLSFESKKRSKNQLQQVRYIRSLEIDELFDKVRKLHPEDKKIHNEIQALTQKIKHASIMGI